MAGKWSLKLTLRRLRRPRTVPSSPQPSTGCRWLEEVFRHLDADGDGRISGEELRSFLVSAGEDVSAQAAEAACWELDSDGDGMMDMGDFTRLMDAGARRGDDGDLRMAFEMFEAEKGEGCITTEGLQRTLGRLGDARSLEECSAMIRAYDLDGNGVLDYYEFHRMMSVC